MFSKINTTIALFTISFVVLFAFAAAVAQPPTTSEETNTPSGPCVDCEIDTQNIPGEVNENASLGLNWITSMPVSINPGETKEIEFGGGVARFGWTLQPTGGTGVSLNSSGTNERKNSITAECSATGSYQIMVQDSRERQIEDSVTVNSNAFEFDYSQLNNEDEQVARNSSIVIYVKNGAPPYTWTIANTSFYFIDNGQEVQQMETDVPSVTLYSNSTACGNVEINITDGCSQNARGYIRSTGFWRTVSQTQALVSGRWQWWEGGSTPSFHYIEGKYKVRQSVGPLNQDPYNPGIETCENIEPGLLWCPAEIACLNPLEVQCGDPGISGYYPQFGEYPHCYIQVPGNPPTNYINEKCTNGIITYEWRCN